MGTFSELQTRVQRRIIDLPAAVLTEVPTLINEAIRAAERKHNFKVMEKYSELVTVEGARTLGAKPSNFKEFRDEPWFVGNTGATTPLTLAPHRSGIALGIDAADTGRPRAILEGDPTETGSANWEVYPLPDGNSDWVDGEYRVKIPYWGYVADLVNGSDSNWFTVNAEEYIVNMATSEGFAMDWDQGQMAIWAQRAQTKLLEVINADKRARVAGVIELVPQIQGGNSPRVRW